MIDRRVNSGIHVHPYPLSASSIRIDGFRGSQAAVSDTVQITASHGLLRLCGIATSTALGLGFWVFDVCLGVFRSPPGLSH